MQDTRLIMFDLDGTLIATAGEIQDAVNDTLTAFGLTRVSQSQVETWIGHGTRSLLAQAVAAATGTTIEAVAASDCFDSLASDFDVRYRARCGTRSRLYPYVLDVLEELRRRDVRLAVVTNKESSFTQVVLDRHGIRHLLDDVVSGDTAPAKKPDPAGLLACIARFGLTPCQALFVGDSGIDVAAARQADVTVWAVTYGYNMGRPIAGEHPDRVLADLRPLLTIASAPGAREAGAQRN